jgi:uncharacterized protein (DUF2235 family)
VIRHAVGIDERRAKFRQDLIDKVDIAVVTKARTFKTSKSNKKKDKNNFLAISSASVNKATNGSMTNGNSHHQVYAQQVDTACNGTTSPSESMVSFNILIDNESDSDDEGAEQDIEEVWFPGCHGDVGGGWDLPDGEEPLSQGPLVWMVCTGFHNCLFFLEF